VTHHITAAALATRDIGVPIDLKTAALDRLIADCRRFAHIEAHLPARTLDLLHQTVVAMHSFATAVTACEDSGLTRLELLPHLGAAREIHARSPFVHRLQTWPRGYPGDFETVEWLCDARNRAPIGTLPWAIEQCALQSPLAQQHRNKVALQARAILSTLVADPTARIASIGCGGCRDLSLIQEYLPASHGTFVLVDADADALAFARARLDRIAGRCTFVQGRVPRAIAKLPDIRFDLVVAGGLFDYLSERWAVATLSAIRERLAPGGRVFLSNIAEGNPFRPWIEYLADWWLIERAESDVVRLLEQAGFDARRVRVSRDSTGLALMAEAVV
jgi:extracellular factor (EF) 3-hydroxypalmitic acid methyl ester biosynthesis protein